MRLTTTLCLAALLASGPAAAGMPAYDVEAFCAADGAPDACRAREQAAHDKLAPQWDGLSRTIRDYCDYHAAVDGTRSYDVLWKCVKRHVEALEENHHFNLLRR